LDAKEKDKGDNRDDPPKKQTKLRTEDNVKNPSELLPNDVFVLLILFLNLNDTLTCLLVNKEWKRLVSAKYLP